MHQLLRVMISAAALVLFAHGAAAQTLPGGASEIQETHGDWRVTCASPNGTKVCAFTQQQTNKDSRQLVIGIELKPTSSTKAEGTIILPFGLAVDKPVVMRIDDGTTQTAHFRTCLPVGCVVPVVFDDALVERLRKGAILNVTAITDNGREAAFRIPLNGFGSALARTADLSK